MSKYIGRRLYHKQQVVGGHQSDSTLEGILDNLVGFGNNTTGGAGGTVYHVTNLNNSGAGSLRDGAESTGAKWIVFDVSGTIVLSDEIAVRSNKTIDGRGQNILIENRGFTIGWFISNHPAAVPASNVIIHNIRMNDITGNASIIIGEDASDVWIDHCSFLGLQVDDCLYMGSSSQTGDGGFPGLAPFGATVSWCYFQDDLATGIDGHKVLLISDPSLPTDVDLTITLHHNHYNASIVRHPMARWGKIHSFNNYYDRTEIGAQIREHARFYSENDIFQRLSSYPMVKAVDMPPEADADNVKVIGQYMINSPTLEQINESTIFNPSSFYSYTPDTANETLRLAVVAGAGWQDVPLPS